MLLNLGLTADAAAAHTNDLSVDPETPPAQSTSYYSQAFSLSSLLFLGGLYSTKQADGPSQPPGVISSVAMSPTSSTEGETSQDPSVLAKTRASTPQATRKSTRTKTAYQLAHPAHHARHKRLKLRPKLLLQLQQISRTPRPLPILDILPSTVYLPRLARKFPTKFRGRNGLGPYDLIIVMSELYERSMTSGPEQPPHTDDDEDQREVVATICQMLQEDARQKGKAEICLNFGPVWEATPLPSGSYEFVAQTDQGNRRMSAPQGIPTGDDTKRFTFSVIDPTTRRHPVIASMTRNQLEVFDTYSPVVRSGNGSTTPSSNVSVISDVSDDAPCEANMITLDDGMRTLIIVTGIWVAFREGWSNNFSYGDAVSSSTKSPTSPASSKPCSIAASADRVDVNQLQERSNDTRSSVPKSISRRSITMGTLTANDTMGYGSLTRRSNSTGAAFMEKVKRRSSSAAGRGRVNRHSLLNGVGDTGYEIVVPRPASIPRNPTDLEETIKQPTPQAQPAAVRAPDTPKSKPEKPSHLPIPSSGPNLVWEEDDLKDSKNLNPNIKRSKTRHRLSAMFTRFHRKQEAH
ncbi:hypothetical protein N7470_004610 [Penicillium chermesinum]|nr:hypothetical protein N7470_004610 [Penicillium chermesinum]